MRAAATGFGLALAVLAGAADAQAPAGGHSTKVLRAGRLLFGDGRTVDAVRVRIEQGKIVSIDPDQGPLPPGAQVIDCTSQVLIPGLVAAHTELAASDQQSNLTPDLVAADAYDFFRSYDKLVQSGLVTVYLSPGRQRLLAGQGSVVKLWGKDPTARLLAAEAALRVSITPQSRQNIPALFEPTPTPTAEDPLLPGRAQPGSTRESQLAVLERAFGEARDPQLERGGDGPEASRYWLTSLRAALKGDLRVRLAAAHAADALHALRFLQAQGARPILELPVDVGPIGEVLAQAGVPAVLAMPLHPARVNPGDLRPGEEDQPRPRPEAPGELARAGVAVALVPQADADLDKLLMLAGLSCRYGLPEAKALAAVTLEAARALGVERRVGSLEPGKDADIVALSGAPFDARTRVERVFVDGELAYEAKASSATFAIRVGRVLVGDGSEHRDAIVVVRDGKIADAGPDVPVPAGAQRIDAPDAVLVPGFVAAATKLGLHSDGGQPLQAGPDVDVARALRADDAVFRQALEAGITTLCVTPDDTALVSGRVPAVKSHGKSDGFVLSDVAGLRVRLPAGSEGKAQLQAAIKRARDYVNPPKEEKKPEPPKPDEAKPADLITGSWKGTASGGPLPQPTPFTCDMKLTGKDVEATLKLAIVPMPVAFTGTFENDELKMRGTVTGLGDLDVQARLSGTTFSGTIRAALGELSFTMTREETTPPASDDKKGPKKDEALEPWRRVLAGAAPLVVRAGNAEAAKVAIEVAVAEKLRLVLEGPALEAARKKLRPPEGQRIGWFLGADEIVHEDKGVARNLARDLSDLGYEVILVCRAQLGTRYLPVHAAWAVANGFDPRRALAAISGAAARGYGLDQRVGMIAPGRDADLVLLNGDPFDLTTRLLAVWVDGELRLDRRERTNQ